MLASLLKPADIELASHIMVRHEDAPFCGEAGSGDERFASISFLCSNSLMHPTSRQIASRQTPHRLPNLWSVLAKGLLNIALGLATLGTSFALSPPAMVLYSHGDPTPHEQLLMELVNRARANPLAEVSLHGLSDLNQGLAPGTLNGTPKPPLAFHPALIAAARGHSQWMLDTDTFSHTGAGGSDMTDRMSSAGYPFSGNWGAGENIYRSGSFNGGDLSYNTYGGHAGLFISPGHRTNILDGDFNEAGLGVLVGLFTTSGQTFTATVITECFAHSEGSPGPDGPFVTGVVYDDRNANDAYDPGEGLSGVIVMPSRGSYYAVTSTSGGYAFPAAASAGEIAVTFNGGPFFNVERRVSVQGVNVKLDLRQSPVRPEIVVEEPAGTGLVDGTAAIGFGSMMVGTSVAKTFTIRNTGTAALSGLSVAKTGTHAANFAVGALGATSLAAGASTTFTVTFTPTAAGLRTAALSIASNDADENPFNITLGGTGTLGTLTLSSSTRNVAAAGGTNSFSVTSNTSWNWSDNASWVTSSEAATQSGNQTFSYSVAANTGTSSRSAVVTLSGGGLTRTHTIIQSGAAPSGATDRDLDGVMDAEDRYPTDSTRYVDAWRTTSLGVTAATDSPLALMWDWAGVWTVNSSGRLQVTYYANGWQNLVFNTMPQVDRSKGLGADSAWNLLWYVGTDSKLYVAYVNGGAWAHAMIRPGPFARIQRVDEANHIVWTRKSDGTDAAVYWSGTAWIEVVVPTGSAVSYTGVDANLAQLGWTSSGGLVERYWSGSAWLTRSLAGSVGSGVGGDARDGYGYDTGWRNLYYGTSAGALGWSSLTSRASGTLHAGKVWPGSPTWVASNMHWVFARDGISSGNKVRLFYFDGSQWQTAPVAPYANWRGDQAAASSGGALFYVDPSNGQIKAIHY